MSQPAQQRVRRLTKPAAPKPVKVTNAQLQRKPDNKPSSPIEKTPEPVVSQPVVVQPVVSKVDVQTTAVPTATVSMPRVTGKKAAGRKPRAKAAEADSVKTVEPAAVADAVPVAQPAEPIAQVPVEVKKRSYNTKPTAQDISGIGIAAPRVKYVLVSKCLNPQEIFAKTAIQQAEFPTKVNDQQPPSIPIAHLGEEILSVIREAEAEHESHLRGSYEKAELTKLGAKDQAALNAYYTLLSTTKASLGDKFNLQQFNTQYNPSFYAEFDAFKAKNDPYALGAKVSQQALRVTSGQARTHNQWSRANALINKSCIRLSVNTRNILAIFLDKLVEEYAENGMLNCIEQQCSPVHLRHALQKADRVPHDRFVGTFDSYKQALSWMTVVQTTRAAYQEARRTNPTATHEVPEFPMVSGAKEFFGYVSEVCRSVKLRLARHAENEAQRNAFLSMSVTREFRLFCSNIVYEAIMRVGDCLRQLVKWNGTKTINDSLVYHVLQQMHSCVGVNYAPVKEHLQKRLSHHMDWRAANKKTKKPRGIVHSEATTTTATATLTTPDVEATTQDDGDTVAVEY